MVHRNSVAHDSKKNGELIHFGFALSAGTFHFTVSPNKTGYIKGAHLGSRVFKGLLRCTKHDPHTKWTEMFSNRMFGKETLR